MRNHFITTALSALLILTLHTVNARADRGHGGDDDGGAEIRGIIESLPASGLVGDWTVSGRTVHVTASTTIEQEHGQPAVGAPVEVKGDALADGSIDASRIEVEGPGGDDDSGDDNGGGSGDPHGNHTGGGVAKFFGTVESMTADLWTVGGRAVRVTAATVVEREHGVEPSIGAVVKVEGAQLADGSVEARKIEVKTGPAPSGAATGFVQLRAAVDALPLTGLVGELMVGGRTVHVTAATRVEQKLPVQLGVLVEVRGNQRPDGSIDAGAVEVKKAKGGKGRLAKVFGTIESLPASGLVGEWTVGGRTVVVTAATLVKQELGRAAVGALVEVKGKQQADGSIQATVIEVKDGSGTVGGAGYIELRGRVESLPSGVVGDWTVSGRVVHVSASTTIRGRVAVGATVEVEGGQRTDGSVDAVKIHLED